MESPTKTAFKHARGEYRFGLKAANGEGHRYRRGYKTKAAAENGTKSVQTTRPMPRSWIKPG